MHPASAADGRTFGPSEAPVPTGADAHRIGDILVQDGALTADQLAKLLRIQSRLEEHKPIGRLAIELGMLARARLDDALRKHRRGLPIESILVERGAIRPEQVAAARLSLKDSASDLTAHLVEIGAISERVYRQAYAEKHGLGFIDIEPGLVDRQLLKRANLKFLARQRIIPLSVKDECVNLAVEQVPDARATADLRRLYESPVTFWIAEGTKISATLLALNGETGDTGTACRRIQYRNVSSGLSDDATGAAEIVEAVMLRAIGSGASDIHFEPDSARLRVRYRIDGQLIPVGEYPLSVTPGIISRIKVLAAADIAEHRIHQQGRIYLRCDGEDLDLRASFYVTVAGENAVLRILRKASTLVGLEDLGVSSATLTTFVHDVLEPSSGAVIVTGPTGSGKTTTLYASLQRLVDHTRKVITCEDPVEYVVDGVTQCTVSDRPGLSFHDTLKTIVRQDPDVILVGEIRDRESAQMAIECALTGHKVLTTFHTEDTVGALVRLLQMDIEPFLISSTVTAVLGQRLVRRQCVHCRIDYVPTPMEMRALSLSREELASFGLTKGKGCPACHYTGYHGRVGVYELLVLTDALRDLLLQKPPAHEIRRLAQQAPDFVFLQEDGIAKALRGDTTLADVATTCPRRSSSRSLRQLVEMYS